jgi:hypothetical protein
MLGEYFQIDLDHLPATEHLCYASSHLLDLNYEKVLLSDLILTQGNSSCYFIHIIVIIFSLFFQ